MKQHLQKLKVISQLFGVIFILTGFVVVVYLVNRIVIRNYNFDFLKTFFTISFIATVVYFGILLIRDYTRIINLSLLISSMAITLLLMEIVLSTGYFDNLDSDKPVWIPYRYKLINEEINKEHHLKSAKNKFGFNDIRREYYRKSKDQIRIAVMGDSFIWGAAVEDSVIWSHKLQKKFNDHSLNVEILHWGVSNWSSKDERDFLYNNGYKFDINMIIVGVVVNDVDSGKFPLKIFINRYGIFYKILQRTILKIFPNSISFIIDYLNAFSNNYLGYGYENWLKLNYEKENLLIWRDVIQDILAFGKEHQIEILFILTPENRSPSIKNYFKTLETILTGLDANVINLYPVIVNRLEKYSNRQLWANPADGHPGSKVTKIYAEYTFGYLLNSGLIEQLTF
ncbi:MAG: hypothetical protein IH950_01030 [Bacteroidetes bacterium]|nr:hypothetical protein [Bacteroidota bacterium]